MKVVKKLRKAFPICFINAEEVVIYKFGRLLTYNLSQLKIRKKIKVREDRTSKLLRFLPYFDRALRHSPRCGIALDATHIIVNFRKCIIEYDLENGLEEACFVLPSGIRPLQFSRIESIEGFEDGIYFGGYLVNPSKNAVSIYKRIGKGEWREAFTFKKGQINHIHALVPDTFNQCVWVFTGDDNDGVGIWRARDDFKKMEKVAGGNQMFRGCVAFPTPDGLVYATDSQWERNSIRVLRQTPNGYVSEEIAEINGSCIYGCTWKDKFVFETTVEGEGLKNNLFHSLTSHKIGTGIQTPYTCIYIGNLVDGFEKVYSIKKDFMPFLFQFGAFLFPQGHNRTDYLMARAVATSKHDMATLILK